MEPEAEHEHRHPRRLRHLSRRVGDGRMRPGPTRTRPTPMPTPSRATTSRRCARWRPASPTTVSRSIPANYRGDWTTIDPNFKQGRVQQWSVNVERKLPFSTIASVAYAGSYADRLFDKSRNLNTATPGPGFNPAARRPYPQLQAVIAALSRGWMKYNSLQFRIERRSRRRVLPPRRVHLCQGDDQRRVRLRRRPGHRLLPGRRRTMSMSASANTDLRHNFSLSALYQLPWWRDADGTGPRPSSAGGASTPSSWPKAAIRWG